MFSLGEAARNAGVSKTTIHRAIKAGRLSAQRNDDGTYSIDPAELFRVYPPKRSPETVAVEQTVTPSIRDREIQLLEERIEELKADRDAWRDQAERLLLAAPTNEKSNKRRWWQRG